MPAQSQVPGVGLCSPPQAGIPWGRAVPLPSDRQGRFFSQREVPWRFAFGLRMSTDTDNWSSSEMLFFPPGFSTDSS